MKLDIIGAAVLAAGVLWSASAYADPIHLKFAFANPDTDTIWVSTLKPFLDDMNAKYGAKIVFDEFPNGALGKNLAQQPQLVQSGVADAAFVIPSVTPGRFSDTDVLGLPGEFNSLRELTLVHTAMAKDGDFSSYKDFFVLGAFGSDPFSIHTVRPVASVADLHNMKIRSSGGIQSHILTALGATPVFMGLPDVPEALGRRNLDGVAIQMVPLQDWQLTRITTNHYFMDIGGAPIAILMNKAKYDALPADVQAILDTARADLANRYVEAFEKQDDAVLASLKADPKHKLVYPSATDQVTINAAYSAETKAWVGTDAGRQAILAKLQAELKKVRDGQS